MASELLPVWALNGTAVAPDSTKRAVGWTLGEKPPYEYMNWWQRDVATTINTILQQGPAPWAPGTTYAIGNLVSRAGLIYRALTINANSAPPSVNWLQVTQNAGALTSGTVHKDRLPTVMNGVTVQSTSANPLVVERVGAAINSLVEFKSGAAGSIFVGQASEDLFAVGPIAAQHTAANRRFSVSMATGNIAWSGTASGDGSGLTQLNAAAMDRGTLPNARLAGDYTFANLSLTGGLALAGTVSGASRYIAVPGGSGASPTFGFAGVGAGAGMHMLTDGAVLTLNYGGSARLAVNATAVTATGGAAFTGSGAGLTGVPADALTGTLPNARLSGNYSFTNLALTEGLTASTIAAGNRFSVSAGTAADVGYGFAGYPNLGFYRTGEQVRVSVMGTPIAAFTANGLAMLSEKVMSGDGSGLVALNANALATGLVPDARIPESLAARQFVGNSTSPGLRVYRNSGVNIGMAFEGSGSATVLVGQGAAATFAVAGGDSLSALSGNPAFTVGINSGNVAWAGVASGDGRSITNLNAAAMDRGTLPNARLAGDYTFANLSLSEAITAPVGNISRVNVGSGSAADPTIGFIGVTGIGMYRSGTALLLAQGGTAALSIGASTINAGGGRVWGGDGSNLTNLEASNIATGQLNAARLPDTTAANNWNGARSAALPAGAVGTYVYAWRSSGVDYGSTYPGSELNPGGVVQSSGAADLRRDSGTNLSGTWRAVGYTTSGSNGHSTLFKRIS